MCFSSASKSLFFLVRWVFVVTSRASCIPWPFFGRRSTLQSCFWCFFFPLWRVLERVVRYCWGQQARAGGAAVQTVELVLGFGVSLTRLCLKNCMFSALSKKQSSAQTAELSQSRHSPASPLQCFHYVSPWISAGRPHVCPISTSTWACPWPLCAELMFSQFPLPWVFFFFFFLPAIQEPRLF